MSRSSNLVQLCFADRDIEILREALRMAASRHETYAASLKGSLREVAVTHDDKAAAMRDLELAMQLATKACRVTR